MNRPKRYYSLLALILVAVLCAALICFAKLHILWSCLISITMVTFLIYGFDKHQAKTNAPRIPEIVLHLLALTGGTLGALTGQLTFRHKTRKTKFQIIFWLIAIAQAITIFLLKDHILNLLNP
ncbi:unnamed protein product [marine sediment metagenome]|uniref:DUF1294 domain-containing protein n=1 Tax=marine sediment metagenome TaxID=412755 RepID=X0SEV4_9ZZZZ